MTTHAARAHAASMSATEILYGRRFDDGSPVAATPFHPDGATELTAVLGRPGSGKSYWLADHAARLADAGVHLIAIDPLGDLRDLMAAQGARTITLGPGAPSHINPFARAVDDAGADLRPVFQILLGVDFTAEAEAILARATAEFYADADAPERGLDDFVAHLRGMNVNTASNKARDEIANALERAAVEGDVADLFTHKTDVALTDERPLRINFTTEVFSDETGRVRALSMFAALGLAHRAMAANDEAKTLIINDLDIILRSHTPPVARLEALTTILRSRADHATAVVFAMNLGENDGAGEVARRAIAGRATSFVLMRADRAVLEVMANIAGIDPDILQTILVEPKNRPALNESRPAVYVHRGIARAVRIIGSPPRLG